MKMNYKLHYEAGREYMGLLGGVICVLDGFLYRDDTGLPIAISSWKEPNFKEYRNDIPERGYWIIPIKRCMRRAKTCILFLRIKKPW